MSRGPEGPAPGNDGRWTFAALRILRNLHGKENGLRTSVLKRTIREEENQVMSLKRLTVDEFQRAIDFLLEKQMVTQVYPGDATQWIVIQEAGTKLLDDTTRQFEEATQRSIQI